MRILRLEIRATGGPSSGKTGSIQEIKAALVKRWVHAHIEFVDRNPDIETEEVIAIIVRP